MIHFKRLAIGFLILAVVSVMFSGVLAVIYITFKSYGVASPTAFSIMLISITAAIIYIAYGIGKAATRKREEVK